MKTKKMVQIPVLFLSSFLITGCSISDYIKLHREVKWCNYDGSVLEIDKIYSIKRKAEYNGKTPTKPTDDAATYTFAGWDKPMTTSYEDKTFTATFTATPREYKVHWLNYDNKEIAVSNVAYGTVPRFEGATPVRQSTLASDYIFAGWDRPLVAVKGETSYKAVFNETKYNIVRISFYTSQTVNEITNPNVDQGKTYIDLRAGSSLSLKDASCANYDFNGWFLDSSFTKPAPATLPNIEENQSLYGKFDLQTYTITYNLDGGAYKQGEENLNPKSITYVDSSALVNPSKVGYEFVGWYDQDNRLVSSLENVTKSLNLKARYSANVYTITLHFVEKNDQYLKVEFNGRVPSLPNVSKDGYNFLGWFDENGVKFTKTKYDILGDIELWYQLSAPIDYSINYILDGGVNPSNAPTSYSIVNQPDLPVPTKTGYTFGGWYDGSKKVENLRGIFKNLSLRAHWTANDVTLTFDYDGGSLERNLTFLNGDSVVKEIKISPANKVGYERLNDIETQQFNGWYNMSNSRESFTSDKVVEGDYSLRATWVAINSGHIGARVGEDAEFQTNGLNSQVYQYTPLVSSSVDFTSLGSVDVKAELRRKSDNQLIASNDDISSTNKNFKFTASLSANTSYLLKVYSMSDSKASVTVKATSSASLIPAGKISAEAWTINENVQKFDERFVSVGTPVKEGKVFAGWADENNIVYEHGETVLKNTSINLKAIWNDA